MIIVKVERKLVVVMSQYFVKILLILLIRVLLVRDFIVQKVVEIIQRLINYHLVLLIVDVKVHNFVTVK
jgi:hypothetical protein